jgi:hypothetical protein
VHLFGFDLDIPNSSFKHYYNDIKVAAQKHDYTLMARAFLPWSLENLLPICATANRRTFFWSQGTFFKVLHVGGFLRHCAPYHLEDAPVECFFPARAKAVWQPTPPLGSVPGR